jgi:hypothetical protein
MSVPKAIDALAALWLWKRVNSKIESIRSTESRMLPDRKVAVGAGAGSIGTVVIWLAGLAGVDVPPEVAAALVTVITFVVSYFVRSRSDVS